MVVFILQNCFVEVSDNGNRWEIIDQHSNGQSLNSEGKICTLSTRVLYEFDFSFMCKKSCGITVYMVPEAIPGERYDGKSDVYAFVILMYEVLTETLPYPAYQSKKLSDFNLKSKIVNEDFRPEFTVPVKPVLKKLVMQCWTINPKDRPTFEEIYNKQAFNIESSVFDIYDDATSDDKDDSEEDMNKYYLEDVDVDKILFIADDINDSFKFNDTHSKSDEDEISKLYEQMQRKDRIFRQKMSFFKTQNQQLKDELQKQQQRIEKKI